MIKIEGRESDLGGGMRVHRILPDRKKRMVGPFCFLDHMGPITIAPNQDTDVRPHPHIGLSTLTYLFEGRMVHRDSLGNEAIIEPGEVNWMTSGRGISHSERAHAEDRGASRRLHGLQFWVALPDGKEEISPNFSHYQRNQIPIDENEERQITLVAGENFGLRSPVVTSSPLVCAEIKAKKNFAFEMKAPGFELAMYLIHGCATASEEKLRGQQMLVFERDYFPLVKMEEGSHLIIIGGEPFATPRHIWWNLVSSSKQRMEEAKKQWRDGTFPMVPGETDFIPLPE